MRDTFESLYEDCDPTAYLSEEVHAECISHDDDDDDLTVEECASANFAGGANYLGLYCKKGPGLSDFTIDKAMAFPSQADSLSIHDFIETRTFGYFANYACMPTKQRFDAIQIEMAAISRGQEASSTFGQCYSSDWWGTPDPPTSGGKFVTNDDIKLSDAQMTFFDDLDSNATAQSTNDKMIFCFCSDNGKDSKLYSFLQKMSSYSKWIALGATIFFLLVFISECYLCCCAKDNSDKKEEKQTWLRP